MVDDPENPMVPRLPEPGAETSEDAPYVYRPTQCPVDTSHAALYETLPQPAEKDPTILVSVSQDGQEVLGFNAAHLGQTFTFQFQGFTRTARLTDCHSFCDTDETDSPTRLKITLDFDPCPDV